MIAFVASDGCWDCPERGHTGCCRTINRTVASFEVRVRDYIEDPIKLDDLPRNRAERRRKAKTGRR